MNAYFNSGGKYWYLTDTLYGYMAIAHIKTRVSAYLSGKYIEQLYSLKQIIYNIWGIPHFSS